MIGETRYEPRGEGESNKAMVKMVMDEWVLWHEDTPDQEPDLSLIDENEEYDPHIPV